MRFLETTELVFHLVNKLAEITQAQRSQSITLERKFTEPNPRRVLLTGASGYVGGRLLKHLEAEQIPVRCLARRPEFLRGRVSPSTEVVAGDVLDAGSLTKALDGVDTAYYLVHSMGEASSFEALDRKGAQNFADAARAAHVRRIIYLGGLGDQAEALSPHLRSRHEVGDILRSSGVQVIEFQASVIIGSGSLSFEIIRALTERLPVMITPRWVSIKAQPIAINEMLEYLAAARTIDVQGDTTFEVGGLDVVSYADMIVEYARQRGLRRYMISVPVLSPRLSSLWLGLVTPVYARVGRKLIDSIRHATVVRDDRALRLFGIRPSPMREAIATALRSEDQEFAATRWSDSVSAGGGPKQYGGVRFGNRLIDSRTAKVDVSAAAAFAPIRRLGGANGWLYGDFLWRIRGALDLLVGGVGLRRGRRDSDSVEVGDTLDFWRVECFEPNRRLTLAAEMKLPGRAWLDFEVDGDASGAIIRQTALFDPIGLAGLAYWYVLYPVHQIIFAGMLREIARKANALGLSLDQKTG